jgi:hypothetical protein
MEGVNVGGEKDNISLHSGATFGASIFKRSTTFKPNLHYTFLLDMFLFPIVQECTINAKRPKV